MEEWDEVNINTQFVRELISRMLGRGIKEKFGYDISFQMNELSTVNRRGKLYIHLNINAETSEDEFEKMRKSVGWPWNHMLSTLFRPALRILNKTKRLRNTVSKGIKWNLKKKKGCDVNIQIHEINGAVNMSRKTYIHLCGDAEMKTEDIELIFNDFDLLS